MDDDVRRLGNALLARDAMGLPASALPTWEIIGQLGIPLDRAEQILVAWSDQGWYAYQDSVGTGRVTALGLKASLGHGLRAPVPEGPGGASIGGNGADGVGEAGGLGTEEGERSQRC